MTDRFGQQAVFGRDLVQRSHHQGVVDFVNACRDGALHARDDEIEIVEGAEAAEAHRAALRRLRVDVVETLEACRVFQLAEEREGMTPVILFRMRGPVESKRDRGGNERSGAAAQNGPAGKLHRLAPKSSHPPTSFAQLWQISGASTALRLTVA